MPGTHKSGRKRKPRELKVIEGTFRRDRDANTPLVVGTFPSPPSCLTEVEAKLWETFPKPAWIGETDVVAVHAAVSLYALILANQAAMRATADAGSPLAYKVTYDADGGQNLEPKPNPLYGQQMQLWGKLFSVLASLGLTPADRGKVSVPKTDAAQEDKWAGILS